MTRYILTSVDGDTYSVSLDEFLADNESLDAETVRTIRDLAPGETYADGGGAAPEWSIRRVSP